MRLQSSETSKETSVLIRRHLDIVGVAHREMPLSTSVDLGRHGALMTYEIHRRPRKKAESPEYSEVRAALRAPQGNARSTMLQSGV